MMTPLLSPCPQLGVLYVVATPIGNLGDITLRAIEILKQVDLIAAEDTRRAGLLLQQLAIHNTLLSLHDYNESKRTTLLIDKLKSGQTVALMADAGTPLINDPGYHLVHCCHQQHIQVVPIPGPCAAIAALSVAGIATDKFCYEGFLPAKTAARQARLQFLAEERRTIIFYESTHRLYASLQDIATYFGHDRPLALAKELTKKWETIIVMPVADVLTWLQQDSNRIKGEFVLVVEGCLQSALINASVITTLKKLMGALPIKKAVALTANIYNVSKNQLYTIALQQSKQPPSNR